MAIRKRDRRWKSRGRGARASGTEGNCCSSTIVEKGSISVVHRWGCCGGAEADELQVACEIRVYLCIILYTSLRSRPTGVSG